MVTVTAGQGALRELRFGRAANALIDAGSQSARIGNFTAELAGAQQVTFAVRRAGSGSVTVPLVVRDECGDWPSLVGGGAAPFTAGR